MCRRRLPSAVVAVLLAAASTTVPGTAEALAESHSKVTPSPYVTVSPSVTPSGGASPSGVVRAESAETAPDQPAGFSAAPGDGTFTLTFDAPGDGGSPITGYEYSTDDGGTWQPLTDVTDGANEQAEIGYESSGNGTVPLGYNVPYDLRVRAVNAVGPGTPGDKVTATIAPKAPDAPGPVSVSVEDGAIVLGFEAPRDYGSAITEWAYTTDNGTTWQPLTVSGSGPLTAGVTNQSTGDGSTPLQPGEAYRLRLHATSAAGMGQDSQTYTVSVPTPGAPAAPTSVVAGPAGESTFRVTFTEPAAGDSPILKYEYSSDDGNNWRDATVSGDGPLEADLGVDTLSGFPFGRGATYRIRVRAVNTQGAGPASDAAEVSFPAAEPGTPHNLGVVARAQGGFTLTFNPVQDNGSPLSGWEYTTDDGDSWQTLDGVTGDRWLSATVLNESAGAGTTPLTSGTAYRIRIHARNSMGAGPDSPTVTAALPNAGAPGAPGDLSVSPGDRAFRVTFTAPGQGDSAILKYQYSTDDGGSWSDIAPSGDGPLQADLTVDSANGYLLYPGNEYRVRVRAVNTQGPGLPSDAAAGQLPATAPGAPFYLGALARADGGLTLGFAMVPDNGSRLTGWEYTTDDGTSWRPLTGVTGEGS